MTAVASQPTILRPTWMLELAHRGLAARQRMIIAMIGTAATPLITALQNRALIGSMWTKLSADADQRRPTAMAP